jgi:hypothetical protein
LSCNGCDFYKTDLCKWVVVWEPTLLFISVGTQTNE